MKTEKDIARTCRKNSTAKKKSASKGRSPTLEQLRIMEAKGVELVLCKTCLDYFHLTDQAAVGIVGGMPDIIEAMQKADKVISL